MTRTIWLASYPKSGNTWLRVLIGNLWAEDGEPTGLNRLIPCGIASDALCRKLQDEFDVSAETCHADVETFFNELAKHGAILLDPSPAS